MPSPVRLSVCPSVLLSVTRVDQSKTVQHRITQSSPQCSPMTLVSSRAKCERGMKKTPFSHCRYCIPIHQAALLSRAEPGVSRPFLFVLLHLVVEPFQFSVLTHRNICPLASQLHRRFRSPGSVWDISLLYTINTVLDLVHYLDYIKTSMMMMMMMMMMSWWWCGVKSYSSSNLDCCICGEIQVPGIQQWR